MHDVNLIVDDIRTIERNIDVLLNACKDIGIALDVGKSNYLEVGHFRQQSMMANEHITVGSNSYEKVKTFKYLASLLKNQNYVHEEIKCGLKAGNSCFYPIQTLCPLKFPLKFKN